MSVPLIILPDADDNDIFVAIRVVLGANSSSYEHFQMSMEELRHFLDIDHQVEATARILRIIKILANCPAFLYQLQERYFFPYRLHFDVRQQSVNYLVLQTPSSSRIVTLGSDHGLLFNFHELSSRDLLEILVHGKQGDEKYDYLHNGISDPTFQGCLAQLAVNLFEANNIPGGYGHRGKLLQYLRHPSGVPPSLIMPLENVDGEVRFAETMISNLYRTVHSGKVIIIKRPRSCPSDEPEVKKQHESEVIREALICHLVRHENVLSCLGVTFGPEDGPLGLVIPYMDHGPINRFLKQDCARDINRLTLIWQVAKGVRFLHHKFGPPIAHRDIKPSNILVGNDLVPRLSDLGLSSSTLYSRSSRLQKDVGTLQYIAPEVLTETVIDYLKADIFSFGITIYEIIHEYRLNNFSLMRSNYGEGYLKDMVARTPKCSHPPHPSFWKIVELMVNLEPSERPDINIVLGFLEDNDFVLEDPCIVPLNSFALRTEAPVQLRLDIGGVQVDSVPECLQKEEQNPVTYIATPIATPLPSETRFTIVTPSQQSTVYKSYLAIPNS